MEYATDEERVEEIKKWWKENGTSVVFGVVLGLSILFGWRWWGDYQVNQSLQASTLYSQLQLAIQQKKQEEASALSDKIFSKYEKHTYAVYAALTMAKQGLDNKDTEAAKRHLQWALDHAETEELKHLARIRLARVLMSEQAVDEAQKLVMSVGGGEFAAAYEELKGDILVHKGQSSQALAAYQKASALSEAGARGNPGLQFKMDDLAEAK